MSAAFGAAHALPRLSPRDLMTAARIGWEEGRDTAEICDLINANMHVEPVTEADIANALARHRDGEAHVPS